MASLNNLLSKTLKPIRLQSAYKEAILIHDWETVVGKEFAQAFIPINIQTTSTGKVLRIQTSSSGMATAAYVEPLLLERVNRFFGTNYISNLKTSQGQIKKPIKKPLKKTPILPKTLDEALQALGYHLGITDSN